MGARFRMFGPTTPALALWLAMAPAQNTPPPSASAPPSALRIVVIAGQDGVNVRPSRTVTPVVEVRDRDDRPLPAVPVQFTVRYGASGGGGVQVLSSVTGADGRATASAFAPFALGPLEIDVSATVLGETARAVIKQTTIAPETSPMDTTDFPREGGSWRSRTLWAGVGGAAAGLGIFTTRNRNHKPVPGTITVTPQTGGMAVHTKYTFTGEGASDPDGDSIQFFWNFSDGVNATGQVVTHSFPNAGLNTVKLSVGDTIDQSPAPDLVLDVLRTMAGPWDGGLIPFLECRVGFTFQQNGSSLLATQLAYADGCSGSSFLALGTISPVSYPATVDIHSVFSTVTVGGQAIDGVGIRFVGTVNVSGTLMTGTITTLVPSMGISESRPAVVRRF